MAIEIRCAECGAKCKNTDSYCPSCQASIKRQDLTHYEPLEGIEMEKWKGFIVKSTEHYIDMFRKYENKKVFARFNPWAFLWCLPWFLYRKMYLQSIIIAVFMFLIISGFLLLFNVAPFLSIILMFASIFLFLLTVGLFANAIYKAHVKREISKPEPNMKRGGTSVAAIIIGSIIYDVAASIFVDIAFALLVQ